MKDKDAFKKTNAHWYLQLPEPYRMQALQNAEKEDMLDKEVASLAASLCAFPWENSPQGHDYWKSLYEKLKD